MIEKMFQGLSTHLLAHQLRNDILDLGPSNITRRNVGGRNPGATSRFGALLLGGGLANAVAFGMGPMA